MKNNLHLILVIILSCIIHTSQSSSSSNDQKVAKLNSLLSKDNLVQLNDDLFKELVSSRNRNDNFTLVLLATALDPKIGCEPCRQFHSEYILLSKSNQNVDAQKNSLYFAYIDYSNGRDTFSTLGLSSAPNIFLLFSDTDTTTDSTTDTTTTMTTMTTIQWDMSSLDADVLANWLNGKTGNKYAIVEVKRPVNYYNLIIGTSGLLLTCVVLYRLYSRFQFIISNPLFWSIISLVFIIHMSSGYMWNQIRGAAYAGKGHGGKMEVVMGQFSGQYQIESQIVSVLYAVLSGCIVFMTTKSPTFKNVNIQKVSIYSCLFLFVSTYSILIYIFRYKNNGTYPFSLFL